MIACPNRSTLTSESLAKAQRAQSGKYAKGSVVLERNTWKIPINEETSDEDIERCILDAADTRDINVQQNAARAIVEKERRHRTSELSVARERIAELERTITGF